MKYIELLKGSEIKKILEDFVRVKDIGELEAIPLRVHISYFKKNDTGVWKFNFGGLLVNKNIDEGYITLTTFKKTFDVDLDDIIIYVRQYVDLEHYHTEINDLDQEIRMWGEEFVHHEPYEDILPYLDYKEGIELEKKIKQLFPKELRLSFFANKEDIVLGGHIRYVSIDLTKISPEARVIKIIKKRDSVYKLSLYNYKMQKGCPIFWSVRCDGVYLFRIFSLDPRLLI